ELILYQRVDLLRVVRRGDSNHVAVAVGPGEARCNGQPALGIAGQAKRIACAAKENKIIRRQDRLRRWRGSQPSSRLDSVSIRLRVGRVEVDPGRITQGAVVTLAAARGPCLLGQACFVEAGARAPAELSPAAPDVAAISVIRGRVGDQNCLHILRIVGKYARRPAVESLVVVDRATEPEFVRAGSADGIFREGQGGVEVAAP